MLKQYKLRNYHFQLILYIAILTVICNLISDIVIALLDPRIRIELGGGDK